MATDLEQGQHERGEFMAHWNAGEAQVHATVWPADRERRGAHAGLLAFDEGDLVGQRDDILQ